MGMWGAGLGSEARQGQAREEGQGQSHGEGEDDAQVLGLGKGSSWEKEEWRVILHETSFVVQCNAQQMKANKSILGQSYKEKKGGV